MHAEQRKLWSIENRFEMLEGLIFDDEHNDEESGNNGDGSHGSRSHQAAAVSDFCDIVTPKLSLMPKVPSTTLSSALLFLTSIQRLI